MGNLANINLDGVDPSQSFDPIPAAWYRMRITNTEKRPTRSGDGHFLRVEHEIDENHHPEYKGRKVWNNVNLWNANPQAAEIAQKELKALIIAAGLQSVSDSSDLHGAVVEVKVSVRAAEGNYDASNDVKGYRAVGKNGDARQVAAAAPAKAAAGNKPPWQR